jgi:hypothetical protein
VVSELSLVRADLGDTIQTGGAETGASTCQPRSFEQFTADYAAAFS